MTIPLVDDDSKNSINTSVIAIKKEIEQINSLLQNLNNKLKSLSDNDFLYRSDLTDTVTVGDNQPVTSNGVANAISEKVDNSYSVSAGTTVQTTSINNDGDILKLEYQLSSSGGTNKIQLLLGMVNNVVKGVFKASRAVIGTTTENTLEIDIDNGLKYNNSNILTASDVAWEDISNAVSLTKYTGSGFYTAYGFTQTKVYKSRNFILLQTRLSMTSTLSGARHSIAFKVTSNRFTISEKSIFSGASFYGDYIIGFVPYTINNDIYIYARTPPNLEIPIGDSFLVSCIIPIEN